MVRQRRLGFYTPFEGEKARFAQLGFNIGILRPGEPNCMYHAEDAQEDFLVLSGECLLIVEGEERPFKAWDFVHCPPMDRHVFVGAGDGPCVASAPAPASQGVGSSTRSTTRRSVTDAGVEEETSEGAEAYARFGGPGRPPATGVPGKLISRPARP